MRQSPYSTLIPLLIEAMNHFFVDEMDVGIWNTVCEPEEPVKGFLYFQPLRADAATSGLFTRSIQVNAAYLMMPVDIILRKAYWSELEANQGVMALQLDTAHSISFFAKDWITTVPKYNKLENIFNFWRVLDNGAAKSFDVSTQKDSEGNRMWYADLNLSSYAGLVIGLDEHGAHKLISP